MFKTPEELARYVGIHVNAVFPEVVYETATEKNGFLFATLRDPLTGLLLRFDQGQKTVGCVCTVGDAYLAGCTADTHLHSVAWAFHVIACTRAEKATGKAYPLLGGTARV